MPRQQRRHTGPAAQGDDAESNHFDHAALFEFSKVINSSLELDFILSHILLTIMGKILSTRGLVALRRDGNSYGVETVKGFPSSLRGTQWTIRSLPAGSFAVSSLDGKKHPWVRSLQGEGVTIVLPLVIAERTIGFLGFGERLARKKLHAKEITYLRSLANISATAIEKSQMIGELQRVNRNLDRRVQELGTLSELGREFSALLDPEKLVRLLVFSLLGQIGVRRYVICVKNGPDMNVVASKIDGPPPQGELLSLLARTKGPTFTRDLIVRGPIDPRPVLDSLTLSVLVPIELKGEARGLLLLGDKLSREQFSEGDLEFVASLGNLAIISLENARLFKEAIEKQKLEDELLIAREIQKGLLPSVIPEIPGFQISATNVSSKQVGGDYYDVLRTSDGRHIIAIGDVSGKGSPAALLMANLQATIRALVPLGLSLGELTGRVNDLMCENTGGDKFVTFFWGAINHRNMTLTYVNAGHNYPYVIHDDGTSGRLEKGGMILGVMKTPVAYEEGVISLKGGDMLVLFTDGISEAMNAQQQEYGEERLERVLHRVHGEDAPSVVRAIHDDVALHTSGAPQSDDITMMVVKIR